MDKQIEQKLYELMATLDRENNLLANEIGAGYPSEKQSANTRINSELKSIPTIIEAAIQNADDAVRANAFMLPFYPELGLINSVFDRILDAQAIKNELHLSPFRSIRPMGFILTFGFTCDIDKTLKDNQKRAQKKRGLCCTIIKLL